MKLLGVLLLVASWRLSAAQVTCDKISSCACKMSDGSGTMDLSPLTKNPSLVNGFRGDDTIHTYYYSPCEPLSQIGECTTNFDTAACQILDSEQDSYRLGQQSQVTFQYVPGAEPFQVVMTYKGGTATDESGERWLEITAVCNPNQEVFITYTGERGSPYDVITYAMQLNSKYACPSKNGNGGGGTVTVTVTLSAGSIMTIVFFCLLVTYFIVGLAFMHGKHGKTGVEMIPNLEFWKSLPGLIKEGALFVTKPCRERMGGGGDGRGSEYEKL